MDLFSQYFQQAASDKKHILLPESDDLRILQAAARIQAEGFARISLVGRKEQVRSLSSGAGLDLGGLEIIDPGEDRIRNRLAHLFQNQRKSRGLTFSEALAAMDDPLYFANMLVVDGHADGTVAGATNTTGHTVRAAIHCVGMPPGSTIVSSFFLMRTAKTELGQNGCFIFSDCAVVPDPTAQQLAEIAAAAADNCRSFLNVEPRVALLSFSTKGSSKDPSVAKVAEALHYIRARRPEIIVDGEFQADAAIIPDVARRKAPGSSMAGTANVLIFPDLNSANIGYKLVERLADAEAIGPVLQGLAHPVNDLSRGCSVEDIVKTVALTAIQAIARK